MVCLDRKHLLEASGWCANAGAKVQKQLLEPAHSLAPCDLPHEGHGKAEVQAQRYDSQAQVGAGSRRRLPEKRRSGDLAPGSRPAGLCRSYLERYIFSGMTNE
jgi:hypothetical protein